MGFDQTQSTRMYRFDKLAKGEPIMRFVIAADLDLFLAHRIRIQEGPGLCAIKLASDLESSQLGEHQLTNADLAAHVTARIAAEALRSSSRGKRSHRGS